MENFTKTTKKTKIECSSCLLKIDERIFLKKKN